MRRYSDGRKEQAGLRGWTASVMVSPGGPITLRLRGLLPMKSITVTGEQRTRT